MELGEFMMEDNLDFLATLNGLSQRGFEVPVVNY